MASTQSMHDVFWIPTELLSGPLKPPAKVVYMSLARRTQYGEPLNQKAVVREVGLARATVARAFNDLVEAGWLDKEIYRLPNGQISRVEYDIQTVTPGGKGEPSEVNLPVRAEEENN